MGSVNLETSQDEDPPGVGGAASGGTAVSRHLPVSLSPRLSVLASQLLDLFFPPRCVACKRRGAWFCARCRSQIETIAAPLCVHCGQGTEGEPICATCKQHPPKLDGLRAAGYLEGTLRLAIHAFKYTGVRELAAPLGEVLAEGYARYSLPADLIVPVPLHEARRNQRGFNQSLLLAEQLSTHTHLPVNQHDLLRLRDTASQVGLRALDRRKNVHGAFAWQGGSLKGRQVLLIDDVCTTGATIEACAAALLAAGAANVWGLTLAREKWQAQG
jgi:ComF family protein